MTTRTLTLTPWQSAALRAGRLKAFVVRLDVPAVLKAFFDADDNDLVSSVAKLPYAVGDVVELVEQCDCGCHDYDTDPYPCPACPDGDACKITTVIGTATVTSVDVRRACELATVTPGHALVWQWLADHPGASLDDWVCFVGLEASK